MLKQLSIFNVFCFTDYAYKANDANKYITDINPDWHCCWLGHPINAGGVKTKCCLSAKGMSFI